MSAPKEKALPVAAGDGLGYCSDSQMMQRKAQSRAYFGTADTLALLVPSMPNHAKHAAGSAVLANLQAWLALGGAR